MSEKSLTDSYKKQLRENFEKVRAEIAALSDSAILLGATKTLSADIINYAVDELSLTYIGENRVQELLSKYDELHKENLHIHFIGTLQKNKVKYIADKVEMIHSLDSLSLAKEIDRQCKKLSKVMDVLVEVNIGGEESKGGIAPSELPCFTDALSEFENIRVCGIMVIPPKCTSSQCEQYFAQSRQLFESLFCRQGKKREDYFLSMGMSDSYVEALRQGSDIVRIGSALFGKREYQIN